MKNNKEKENRTVNLSSCFFYAGKKTALENFGSGTEENDFKKVCKIKIKFVKI